MFHFNCATSRAKQVFAEMNRTSSTEETNIELQKKENQTWNYWEMQEENSACHKAPTLTNHRSSTAQSVGFPKAAPGSRSTPWDTHRYPTARLPARPQSTRVIWTATVQKPDQKTGIGRTRSKATNKILHRRRKQCFAPNKHKLWAY